MKAVITTGDGRVALRTDVPIPTPGRGEVLVRVIAAAQNPSEWMITTRYITKDIVVGEDFAGVVEEIGESVSSTLKKGDRVAGFVYGGVRKESGGSFAEFCVADPELLIPIPEGLDFEDAATLGLAGFTACQVLWQNNRFASLEKPATDSPPILVWGGASAVGQYVIQLAKLSGLQVVTTASPKNTSLLLSLGVDIVFDYRDPEVVAKIREFTSNKLGYAIDCVSSGDTPNIIGECMGPSGGYVGCVLIAPVPRPDVTSEFVLVYTLLGKAFEFPFSSPPNPEHYEDGKRYARILSDLLAAGKLRTTPTKIVPHGLADAQIWIDHQREGKVSGEKIVYRISDTK